MFTQRLRNAYSTDTVMARLWQVMAGYRRLWHGYGTVMTRLLKWYATMDGLGLGLGLGGMAR